MKKIALLGVLIFNFFALGTFANAGTLANYPHLFRTERSLGMGGAYVAVGQDAGAVFYNPATIYDVGVDLAILDLQPEYDNNFKNIYGDLQNAMDKGTDVERTTELTKLISDNVGTPLHIRLASFPHFAWKNFSVGIVGNLSFDARLHNPLSSQGAVETRVIGGYGPIFGASYEIKQVEGLRIGAAAKYMFFNTIIHGFTIPELAGDNFDYKDYYNKKEDYSFDFGVLYQLKKGPLAKLNPQVGLSIMDISDLKYSQNEKIPTTLNIGFAVNPKFISLLDVLLTIDYKDVTKAHSQDQSTWKRLHMGAEVAFFKRMLAVRLGLNQGYGTAGVNLDLWVLKLAYTYYSEEMGAYSGQDKDTRHLFNVSIGW